MLKNTRTAIASLLLVILAACATNNNSSIYYNYDYGYHAVLIGDTLYSIAWRHGIDYRELAVWNDIRTPYTIYAGQRLRLTSPAVTAEEATIVSRPKRTKTKKSSAIVSKKTVGKLVKHEWDWPTKGKVISKYSNKAGGNKGIDIGGKIGQPILAASSGKVVYSGDGLLGYGNLVIVKHSAQYLSAYAHNKKLLVKEGGVVTSGQKIAELGSTGTKLPKLHFEIRHNGKPVDPLKYLPKN